MKKIWSRYLTAALALCLALVMLAGCNAGGKKTPASSAAGTSAESTAGTENTTPGETDITGSTGTDKTTTGEGSAQTTPGTSGVSKPTKGSTGSTSTTTARTTVPTIDYGDVKSDMYVVSADPQMSGTLTVDPKKVVNASIIGGGVNFAFSDYVYYDFVACDGWAQTLPAYFGIEDMEKPMWEQFFKAMEFSGMQYVRLQVNYTQWEPINDNNDPKSTDFDRGFVFSPNFKKRPEAASVPENTFKYMEQMYKVLDQFEKMGCYVILGNWDSFSAPHFCPDSKNWLLDDNWAHDRREFYVKSAEEHAETYAAIMYHLIKEKGYKCVKGFSVYNEPENMDDIYSELNEIYTKCDEHLRRLGIRDKVLIQAFDGGVTWTKQFGLNTTALEKLLQSCPGGMDLISQHFYPKTMDGLRADVEKVVSKIGKRPYIAGEMGYLVLQAEKKDFGLSLFNAGQIAEFFNGGGKGYGLWEYNMFYKGKSEEAYWSMLQADPENEYNLIPDKVNFYPSSLMMKYLPGGTNIVSNTRSGCSKGGKQQVYATVGVKGGQTTILMCNQANEPAHVSINGVDTSKTYRCHYVTDKKCDRIYPGGSYDLGKTKTVSLRPKSIMVLTTYTYGTQTVR